MLQQFCILTETIFIVSFPDKQVPLSLLMLATNANTSINECFHSRLVQASSDRKVCVHAATVTDLKHCTFRFKYRRQNSKSSVFSITTTIITINSVLRLPMAKGIWTLCGCEWYNKKFSYRRHSGCYRAYAINKA